jgi:hypothetical protein
MALLQNLKPAIVCLVKLLDDEDDVNDYVENLNRILLEADDVIMMVAASAATVMPSSDDRPEGCVSNFFEEVVPIYSFSTFKSHFRMNPSTLEVYTLSSSL